MAEEQILSLKPAPRLEQVGDEHSERGDLLSRVDQIEVKRPVKSSVNNRVLTSP
jgi:hypothetical protein